MTLEITPQFLEIASGDGETRRIAYLTSGGAQSGIALDRTRFGVVWIAGFRSVMTSTKATFLAQWCHNEGRILTRFDYSGFGASGGDFLSATISDWLHETCAVIEQCTRGPQILVASSMGGWLALLALRRFQQQPSDAKSRIAGLVMLAPAWDMTERLMWQNFPKHVRAEIHANGVWQRASAYDDEPYPITLRLIEDGRRHLLGDPEAAPFHPHCPIHILHAMPDPDVPWQGSLELAGLLASDAIVVSLIKDGGHRLGRPQDLSLLTAAIEAMDRNAVARRDDCTE